MKKYLNFICPTDCLEFIIKQAFKGEHYFFTSIGNSLTLDIGTVGQIKHLLRAQHIQEISFILSEDNRFIQDALGDWELSEVKGLENFYDKILKEKGNMKEIWQEGNRQFFILSYHLNNKIAELKEELNKLWVDQLIINAKIYKREEDLFLDIYPNIIFREYVSLN